MASKMLEPCENDPYLLKEIIRSDQSVKIVEVKENSINCIQCKSQFDSHAIYFQHKVILEFLKRYEGFEEKSCTKMG